MDVIRKKGKFEQPRTYDPRPVEEPEVRPDQPPMREAYEEVYDEPAPSGKKTGLIVAIVIAAVALALVLGAFAYGLVLKTGRTIYPNVYVAGIDVGGMTREEAIQSVGAAVEASYSSATLNVQLPDRTLSFNPEQTNVALDADEVIDEALAYGREGNPFSALAGYFNCKNSEHYIDLQTVLNLDTDYIREMIDEVAMEVAQEAKASTVDYESYRGILTVQVGQPQRSLDSEGLYEAVYNAFMNSEFEAFPWSYEESVLEPVDLKPYYDEYCIEVQDAKYDEETHTISEEVPGFGFDLDAESQRVALAPAGSTVTIQLEEIEPEITKEQLTTEMFGQKLYSVSTPYVNNPNRTNNLKLACEAINGTILNVGEVFSFNEIVGERTAAKGYLPATVYVTGGSSADELGGGVCQVASSVYYATLFLNLEQVHREPHMFLVTYVDPGMDATVYWGSIDYKFKNTLNHPMKIQANIDNGSVNITFWGVNDLDFTVKMRYNTLETYPWQEVEEVDETKPVGYKELQDSPYTGYKVVTYKTILDKDGNQISDELEATSVYKKRDKKWIVGPPAEEVPEEPEDPWYDPEDPWYDPDDPWYGTEDPLG